MLVLLVSQGESMATVARKMGCSKTTIFDWKSDFWIGKI
jgi:transposase-like protein